MNSDVCQICLCFCLYESNFIPITHRCLKHRVPLREAPDYCPHKVKFKSHQPSRLLVIDICLCIWPHPRGSCSHSWETLWWFNLIPYCSLTSREVPVLVFSMTRPLIWTLDLPVSGRTLHHKATEMVNNAPIIHQAVRLRTDFWALGSKDNQWRSVNTTRLWGTFSRFEQIQGFLFVLFCFILFMAKKNQQFIYIYGYSNSSINTNQCLVFLKGETRMAVSVEGDWTLV